MIPLLNERGEQKKNEQGIPIFVKTKADEELKEFHDLAIYIKPPTRELPIRADVWCLIERYIKIDTKEGDSVAFQLNDAQIA